MALHVSLEGLCHVSRGQRTSFLTGYLRYNTQSALYLNCCKEMYIQQHMLNSELCISEYYESIRNQPNCFVSISSVVDDISKTLNNIKPYF